MADGKLQGLLRDGREPRGRLARTARLQREGLRNLEWLVVRDFVLTETAEFWRDRARDRARRGAHRGHRHRGLLLPRRGAHREGRRASPTRSGCSSGTTRPSSRRATARSDLSFMFHLGRRLKPLYAGSTANGDRHPALTWDYPTRGPHEEPDAEAVLREINGYRPSRTARRSTASPSSPTTAAPRAAAGSTPGCYQDGVNQPARRKPGREQTWVAPEWGLAWPATAASSTTAPRPIRRASPGRSARATSGGTQSQARWTGYDVPDFIADRPPSYRPPPGAHGLRRLAGTIRSSCRRTARAGSSRRAASLDGPLPTHYEPEESPVQNPLYRQQCNPARMEWHRRDNPYHRAFADPRFPYVLTTYRLTEHHTAGRHEPLAVVALASCSRRCSARSRRSWPPRRASRTAAGRPSPPRAARSRPRAGHPADAAAPGAGANGPHDRPALPLGLVGLVRGDPANELIAFVADPNVSIQESKALTGNIRAGRRSFGRRSATDGLELRRPSREGAARPAICRGSGRRSAHPPRSRGGEAMRERASSPTPRSASAARRARSRASSGTSSPTTASSSPG